MCACFELHACWSALSATPIVYMCWSVCSVSFQSFVQLTDAAEDGSDGSLHVLPGFHAAALRYFTLSSLDPPVGGFTPFTEVDHAELRDDQLWLPARRMPDHFVKLFAAGKLPPPCGAAQARSAPALMRKLHDLAAELRCMGSAEPPRAGDYVLWDPRTPHTTGEAFEFNAAERPRAVMYAAFTLVRGNEAAVAEQRLCRDTGLHMSWAPSSHRHDEATADYRRCELSALGEALYGYGQAARGGSVRDRSAAAAATHLLEEAAWAEAEAEGAPDGCLLSGAHCAFFRRYGYVVVEGAASAEQVHLWLLAYYCLCVCMCGCWG